MNILFLHTGLQSFVRRDLEILRGAHSVRSVCNHRRALRNLAWNLKDLAWADLVFCWFASAHFLPAALLARSLGRKLVVVAGGFDVAALPEIGYGAMQPGLRREVGRRLLQLADRVLCVSASNQDEAIRNAGVEPARCELIPHGFPAYWEPPTPKRPLAVSIGQVCRANLERKGHRHLVRLARAFPGVRFKLIGRWRDGAYQLLRRLAPANLELSGYLPDPELRYLLQRARVVVQPSRHEAFGCSVAEAMLYRCVPVVSDSFALPEVVGEAGFVADCAQPGSLERAFAAAMDAPQQLGERARQRILKLYSLRRRAHSLLEVLSRV